MSTPKFITFEGGEGSGKSTQSKLLFEYFKSQGVDVILTREPGGTKEAENIRNLIVDSGNNNYDAISAMLLFYAARRHHVENLIKPALAEGKTVICDRFNDSTVAYQGYAEEVSLSLIDKISEISIGNFKPDITFIIDIPVELGLERANARLKNSNSNESHFESKSLEFHDAIQKGFYKIAESDLSRCRIINGDRDISTIHDEILKYFV